MSRWTQIALLSTAGVWCSGAQALGLGNLEVNSYLNEPLVAEISLISNDPEELNGALVNLASAEDFARVGLDRSLFSAQLQFSVVTNAAGDPVIQVKSNQPVSDPFLSFLLEINWAKGRLLREYTILLDPPVYAPSNEAIAQAPVTTSSITEPERPTPRPVEEPAEVGAERQATASRPDPQAAEATSAPTSSAPAQPTTSTQAAYQSEYAVGAGDTLWQISQNAKPAELSTNEMMMALYRLNPEAFFQNNINALRRGAILSMPGRGDLAQSDAGLALNEVRTQNQQWESYRQRAADNVPTVAETSRTTAELPGSDQASESSESRLELVAPTEEVSGQSESTVATSTREDAERAQLSGQLTRSREDLVVASQQNAEMRSRLAEIEDLVEQYERAINVRDAELADLQTQLELSRQEEALAGEDLNSALDTLLTDASETPADAGTLDEATAESPGESGQQTDSAEAPASTLPVLPTESEPSLMDRLTSLPVIGGLVALMLVLGAFFLMRRRGAAEPVSNEFPFELNTEAQIFPDEDATVALPDVTEADLVAAVRLNPEDVHSQLTLLRHYYSERSADQFETQATALREVLGDDGHPAWAEVSEMGADLVPGSSLFTASDYQDAAEADEPGLEIEVTGEHAFDFTDEAADASALPPSLDETPLEIEKSDLDFDVEDFSEVSGDTNEPELDLEALVDKELVDSLDAGEGEKDWTDATVTAERPAVLDELSDELSDADSFDGASTVIASTQDFLSADSESENFDDSALGADLNLDELATFDDAESLSEPSAELLNVADDQMELPEGLNLETLASNVESDDSLDLAETGSSHSYDDAASEDDFGLDEDLFGTEDTVGTKLDLAKAYLDMGDPDGARGMLEEVLTEGNDEQRGEAEGLLAGL